MNHQSLIMYTHIYKLTRYDSKDITVVKLHNAPTH